MGAASLVCEQTLAADWDHSQRAPGRGAGGQAGGSSAPTARRSGLTGPAYDGSVAQAVTLLDERADKWRALPRCTPRERALAEDYYRSQVLPLLRVQFAEREHAHVPCRYLGLIVAVGEDPTPAILAEAAVGPERVHYVYAAEGEPAVEALTAGLAPYERTRVDDQPLLQAYTAGRAPNATSSPRCCSTGCWSSWCSAAWRCMGSTPPSPTMPPSIAVRSQDPLLL